MPPSPAVRRGRCGAPGVLRGAVFQAYVGFGAAYISAVTGQELRLRRKDKGLTQVHLALLLDVKQSFISQMETGKKAIPTDPRGELYPGSREIEPDAVWPEMSVEEELLGILAMSVEDLQSEIKRREDKIEKNKVILKMGRERGWTYGPDDRWKSFERVSGEIAESRPRVKRPTEARQPGKPPSKKRKDAPVITRYMDGRKPKGRGSKGGD